MSQFTNIAIGLLTTLIGYTIGRLWQRLADQVSYRRAKNFWGPVLEGDFQIVISRFWPDSWRGPTGVVGGGDAIALRELSSYFAKIGSKQFEAVYVDEAGLDRQRNLILLGGPDTNGVTEAALKLIKPNLRIVDPGPGIAMEIHDLAPAGSGAKSAPRVRKYQAKSDADYGMIVRTRNPFNPSKALIIIAGAYGYGTWGGANLAMEERFMRICKQLKSQNRGTTWGGLRRRCMAMVGSRLRGHLSPPVVESQWPQFECVFKVGVFDRRPQAPEIVVFRSLS